MPTLSSPRSVRQAGGLIPACAYIRVSKERTDMISPELQMREIKRFAKHEGYEIVKVVEDIDLTGTTFDNRSVGEVVEDIQGGKYSAVLLWKWSRWGRNTPESLNYIQFVEDAGGEVRSATEDADAKTSSGYMMRGMQILLADVESRQKSEGWKAVQSRRREMGMPHGGAPRFGYQKDGHLFVPDPTTGPALTEAFQRYVAGVPMQRIVNDLNARGIKSVNGNPVKANSLFATMDGGFAAGWLRSRSKPNGKAELRGEFDTWTKGVHEPLISEEVWKAYQEKREKMKATPKRNRTAAHSLSGLVRCECGAKMVSATASNTATWRCSKQQDYKGCPVNGTSARIERLERFVWEWVQKQAQDETLRKSEAERLAAETRAVSDTDRISAEIRRLEGRKERLTDIYMDGDIPKDEYNRKRKEVMEELSRAEDAFREAQTAANANHNAGEIFQGIVAVWEDATPHERREALSRMIRHVTVNKGSHWNPNKYVITPIWEDGNE